MSLLPEIKHALSDLGFVSPLPVQEQAIPLILEQKDIIASAKTGSGKTSAYAIPILQKIELADESIQAVILVPTRELADQVNEEVQSLGKYMGVRSIALYGKQPIEAQRKALKKNPHVVVSTPGRLVDHIEKRNAKLNNVAFFILDEADEMLLMGFEQQIDAIASRLPKKDLRTTCLFSATIPQEVIYLSQKYQFDPVRVEVIEETLQHQQIEQLYYAVDGLKKVDFLREMLRRERPNKVIVFCNTQSQVEKLYPILKKGTISCGMLHGGMEQDSRNQVIRDFKKGEIRLMVTTDLGGRGLHVEGVTHVVNYSVPFEHEQYIHRIGRTGRVSESGVAISLVIPSEQDRFNALEKFLGYKIPCKGGHIQKTPLESTPEKQGKRYTPSEKGCTLKLQAGKVNSRLKTSEIISALLSIPGIKQYDIGKVEILDQMTKIDILNGKEAIVLKAMREKRIEGKLYRVKK